MELLFRPIEKDKLLQMPVLTLAHMGDCVFELLARSYVASKGIYLAKTAHQKTIALVSAKAQSRMIHAVMDELSEEEMGFYRRGRNSKPKTMSKNADIKDYMAATGLEALFGALYFEGKRERIEELFEMCIRAVEDKSENT